MRAPGIGLVEVLVGLCVALLVTASAATLLSGNLRDHRELLMASKLSQGLLEASQVVERELRSATAGADGLPDGLRLRAGVIERRDPSGRWQALTDAAAVTVTDLAVTTRVQDISLADLCSTPCPSPSTACPPHQEVRSAALVITARLTGEPAVTRSVRSRVRLRNDAVLGSCAL
jgi:type IV pilus assembly protein PilW